MLDGKFVNRERSMEVGYLTTGIRHGTFTDGP